jgi:hypothetical protein
MNTAIIAIILAVTTIILSISATVFYAKKTISMQNDYNAKIDAITKSIDSDKNSSQRTNSEIQDQLNAYSLSFGTSNLVAPKITSENITTKNITTSNITSKSINGINAYFTGLLSTPLINSENITVSRLNSSTITSQELNARIINTSNINTSNINSKLVTSEIFSGNLTGNQITANNAVFTEASGNLANFSTLTGNQGTFTNITGNIKTDELNDAPGGTKLNINKTGTDVVAIYNGVAIVNSKGLSVGHSNAVPEGEINIRDRLTIGNTIIKNNELSLGGTVIKNKESTFGGEALNSLLPGPDGNTFIRPGKLVGSVYINDLGSNTYIGGTGNIYANNSIMFSNQNPMIEKNFNNSTHDRYGISLSNTTQRIYAGTKNPSSVNVSFAKFDGTYDDIITVNNDGNTQINGALTMKKNVSLSNNLLDLSSSGDKKNILAYAVNNSDFGVNKTFGDLNVIDGPVLAGKTGGILGTRDGGDRRVLTWKTVVDRTQATPDPKSTVDINGNLTVDGNINVSNNITASNNKIKAKFLEINNNFELNNGKIYTQDGTLKVCKGLNNCKTVTLI